MRRALVVAVILSSVSSGAPLCAHAHHGSPTARAAGSNARLGFGLGDDGPRLDARVGTELTYFDRLRQDDRDRSGGGELLIAALVPSVRLALATGTVVQVRLPVGFVRASQTGAEDETSFGLGDLGVGVEQDVVRLWTRRRSLWSLRVRVGAVAPTGRYQPDAALSVTDVAATGPGELAVTTYNTQASLGAGVWSLLGGVEAGWRPVARLRVGLLGLVSQPVTTTSDDIAWGRDFDVQAGVTAVPWLDVLAVTAGVDYRRHSRDEVPNPEEAGRTSVGGRDEVGVAATVEARLADGLTCAARVHVPVWQRVGGIQLVETVSTQVNCGYAFAL